MRDTLSEIVKLTSNLFDFLYVDGTDTKTEVRAMSEDKSLILKCTPKAPLVDLRGEVAISDLGMLSGLLGFASYNTDTATFSVQRNKRGEVEYAEMMEFKDGRKAGAVFRLTNPATIREDRLPPSLRDVPWEISITPEKSRVTEFGQLAGLYSKVDTLFTPKTQDGNLVFMVGEENSSMHSATMVFHEDVGATLKGTARYPIASFQALMKIAGTNAATLGLTSRGVMGVTVDTQHAIYNYILRASK